MNNVTAGSTLANTLRQIDPAPHLARQKHLGRRYEQQRAHGAGDGEITERWSLRVTTRIPADQWLHLTAAEQPLGLCVRHAESTALIGQRQWHDYEGDARLMAWSMQHEDLIEALQRLLGRALTPINFALSQQAIDHSVAGPVIEFKMSRSDASTAWSGFLALNGALCDEVLDDAVYVPVEELPKRWLGVPIPVALRARGPEMTLDRLRRCAPDDVIVLGQRDLLHASLMAVHSDGSALPARCSVAGNVITLAAGSPATWHTAPTNLYSTDPDSTDKEKMTMSDKGATAPAQTVGASIPVRLSIQTAAMDVTISDLEQLGTGVILPLDIPVAGSNVTILANGAPIGEGELIAAGDKLGVCIGRWRPDGL